MKRTRIARWDITARQGRRLSPTAWRWAVNFSEPSTIGRTATYRRRTQRGHARTRHGARRAIAKVLAA